MFGKHYSAEYNDNIQFACNISDVLAQSTDYARSHLYRPIEFWYIAIIKQILKTALHLFVHQGYHGAYMSFITKKDVKAFKVKGVVKGLSNVLIASQWVMAPGGLPVAAAAGKFAVQRILKAEKREMRL